MPRTTVTVRKLDTKGGEVVSVVAVDQTNGMQCTQSGKQVVLLKAAAASSVNVTFPSVACGHGRTGDVTGAIAAGEIKAFGPFEDPKLWGDGSTLLYINFSGLTGTVEIAAIEI